MNPSKIHNRIKYVAQQQDGEGLFDIFKSAGIKITEVATSKFSKEVAKKLLQQVLKSLLYPVQRLLVKVL